MKLKEFVLSQMRMSHIYQPAVIKALLLRQGNASRKELAAEILIYDPSQIEYYDAIIENMVGKVLRNHRIIEKIKDHYSLIDYSSLNPKEIRDMIELCDCKIREYIEKRGAKIWEHRRKTRNLIPGSIKYQVLKWAKFRCELCGISAEEKALEVDHIVPKNLGGEDSVNNYQALCFSCNSMKRDQDKEDFREIFEIYHFRELGCIFCVEVIESAILAKNNLAYAIYDRYPVTKFHTLIIPLRHVEDFFKLTQAEVNAVNQLSIKVKETLMTNDKSIKGFNIGVNSGETAGQTISHCHLHLIPRRKGDVENPRGGIRNIIPGKGHY